jgi:hypothetical protein
MLPILRSRFDELERQRRALLEELLAHTPEQLQFHPRPGAWSLAQLIQHLVLVEESSLEFLQKKPPRPAASRTLRHRMRWAVFSVVAPYPLRVKAPVAVVLPSADTPVEALVARWEDARRRLAEHLEGIPEEHLRLVVFKHPVGGPLPILETMEFFRLHLTHHTHQIRRIRGAAGWPSARSAAASPARAPA